MAIFNLGIADADAPLVIASIVSVQPAITPEEQALDAAALANLRVQEWIRLQVETAERQRMQRDATLAARATADAIVLWNPAASES